MPISKVGFITLSGSPDWQELTPSNLNKLPNRVKRLTARSENFDADLHILDTNGEEEVVKASFGKAYWTTDYFISSYINTESQIYKVKSANNIKIEYSA